MEVRDVPLQLKRERRLYLQRRVPDVIDNVGIAESRLGPVGEM